jgi:prepilin peptidase dependent protein B
MWLKQRGFTLPEVLMALGIGSMLMLSSAQLYPLLRQRSQNLAHHFQLDQLLRSTVSNIEKDLRRAGFCNGECSGRATVMGQSMGEPSHSCVIIAYDLNRNGRLRVMTKPSISLIAYAREPLKHSEAP